METKHQQQSIDRCRKLLLEVAPDVMELTGVKLDLSKVDILLTDKPINENFEICLKKLSQNTGIPYEEIYKVFQKNKSRKIWSMLGGFMGKMIGGMYENNTIILPKGKVNKLNNRDLKIIIGHELVHYSQDIVAPELFNLLMYKMQEQLKELLNIKEVIHYSKKCPRCGSFMELRKGKYGKFWGCSKYKETGCRGSYNYWYKMDKLIKGDNKEEEALQIEMTAIEGYASYIEHLLEQKYTPAYTEPSTHSASIISKFTYKVFHKPLFAFVRLVNHLMENKVNQYIWGEGVIKYLIREKGYSTKFEDLLNGIREVVPLLTQLDFYIKITLDDLHLDMTSIDENIYQGCNYIDEIINDGVLIKANSNADFICKFEEKLPGIFNEKYAEFDPFLEDLANKGINNSPFISNLENYIQTFKSIEDGEKLFYYVYLLPISRNVAIICEMVEQRYKQVLESFKVQKRKLREVVAYNEERKDDNIIKDALNLLYSIRNYNDGAKARQELSKLIKRLIELDLKSCFYLKIRTLIRKYANKVTDLNSSPLNMPEKGKLFFKFDNYRQCPECITSMKTHLIDHVMTDICPQCGIIFLDPGEFSLLAPYDDFVKEEKDISAIPSDTHAQRICPECLDKTMDKIDFLNDSGIILDVCSECGGTVLDPKELSSIKDKLTELRKEHSWQYKIIGFFHKASSDK